MSRGTSRTALVLSSNLLASGSARQEYEVLKLNSSQIFTRAQEARRLSSPCRLCPRTCGVDRIAGERGYCGAGPEPSVAAAVPHFGEEPPLCGAGGAGTVFFCRCNLRCVYCQNHQISQGAVGSTMTPRELCEAILQLQSQGCSTIEPVSPSHHLPGLLEALAMAVDRGLRLPVVYNTNGYEAPETLDLLDGIVDVYLPDIKYADSENARRFSDVPDYVDIARKAILQMHAQVGNLVVDLNGLARQGLIIRHLVLPEDVSGTRQTLAWLRESFPRTVTISLMAQYSPMHLGRELSPLHRAITQEEYDRAVDFAWNLGLEQVFVQDLESIDVGIPDFQVDNPFNWC